MSDPIRVLLELTEDEALFVLGLLDSEMKLSPVVGRVCMADRIAGKLLIPGCRD
jgi:hypothetical protein